MKRANTKKPDVSIVIPTYNRSHYLRLAVGSVLRQKDVSLEIIVGDDCSTDDTRDVVKAFGDTRIRYFKNRKTLNTGLNFKKCFLKCRGDYIFTLSDDDFILDEYTLREVLIVMKRHKLGMGKIGTITYEESFRNPYQVNILHDTLFILNPKTTKDILTHAIDFGLGFFSGLIFDNRRLDKTMFTAGHVCKPGHLCSLERPAAFDLIQKYGIAFIPNYFIVSRVSFELMPSYFNIGSNGWFFIEHPIDLAAKLCDANERESFKKKFLRTQMILLPNIKYFTDNGNHVRVIRRMLELDSTLIGDPRFIFLAMVGFLPKVWIGMLRRIKVYLMKHTVRRTLDNYHYPQRIAAFSEDIGLYD